MSDNNMLSKGKLQTILLIRLILKILFVLVLYFLIIYNIRNSLPSYNIASSVKPINHMEISIINSTYKSYFGPEQKKELALQLIESVISNNNSTSRLVAIKYYSNELCMFTDNYKSLMEIRKDIQKNKNVSYSIEAKEFTFDGVYSVIVVKSSNYSDNGLIMEEDISSSYTEYLNNIKKQNVSTNSKKLTQYDIIKFCLLVIVVICIIIFIFQYIQSIKKVYKDTEINEIYKLHVRCTITWGILLVILTLIVIGKILLYTY